jgi:glutamate racemase
MSSKPLAFFDSGIGGLPYLEWIRNQLPEENYSYTADNLNFPYGEKPIEKVRELVLMAIEKLIKKTDPKLIVIACNTASVIALTDLRKTFPIPFVGVVPAVKPAAENSKIKKLALLATSRTVEDVYVDNLIMNFAADCRVYKYPLQPLVRLIEEELFTDGKEKITEIIKKAYIRLKEENMDTAVLGCTHFTHIYDEIKSVFGKDINIIDSREGVGRQIIRIIKEKNIGNTGTVGKAAFYLTAESSSMNNYNEFIKKYQLEFKGILS